MIPEAIATSQTLIPVATGKAQNGQPYTVEVAPDYLAYQDRLEGARLYRHGDPFSFCENADQVEGWLEERDWYIGQAQYLRALELEDCPASFADPYMSKPLGWEPPF